MRLVRRLAVGLAVLALALVLAAGALLAALRSERGRAIVRPRLEALLGAASGARVALGALESPRLDTIVLRDVVVSFAGRSVLRAARVEMVFGLPGLPPSPVVVRRLAIERLAARLERRDGSFGVASGGGGGAGSPALRIEQLVLRDARIGVRLADDAPPRRAVLSDVDLDAGLRLAPDEQRLEIVSLHAVPRGVPVAPVDLAARVTVRNDGSLAVDDLRVASGANRLDGRLAIDRTRDASAELWARALDRDALAWLVPGLALPPGATVHAAARGPRHDLRVRGTIDLAAAGTLAVRGRVDATADPLAYRVAIDTPGVVAAALRADWPAARTAGTVLARGRGRRHTTLGRLAADGIGRVRWRGSGVAGRRPAYRLSGAGEVRDLSALASGLAGRLPFRVAIVRPAAPESSATRVDLEVGPGTLHGQAIREGRATATVDAARVRVESLRLAGPRGVVAGDATVEIARRTGGANLAADLADGTRVEATLLLARERSRWLGTLPRLEVTRGDLGRWSLDAPATVALGGGARLGPLRFRSGAQHATLDANVSATGRLDGTLAVSGLDLRPWCALGGIACTGTTTATLVAGGTVRAPTFALDARAGEVAAGLLQRAGLDVRIRYEQGRASGEIRVEAAGGSVVVAGAAPLAIPGVAPAPSGTLDLQVTARRLSLARLAVWWPRMVSAADGRLRADLHVGGTWASPVPSGTVTARAAELTLVPSGARWTDLHAVLRADGGHRLAIERLVARGGDGTLSGTGAFDFGGGWIPEADGIRLTLDRFLAVDRPVLEASATGVLRIQGRVTEPVVRGRLYLPEGAIRPAFLPAANAATEPDPTIEVTGLPEDGEAAVTAGLGGLTLGLTFGLGDGMRIRRHDADIQLGGTIRVERTPPEELHVTGTVEIERGWYTFSGRRFTLREGTVRFAGGTVGDAKLDIEARRRAGEYDVTIAIAGTVADPVLLLSSDPPLDEADVLAVLVVGRPAGELSDEERLAVQAEAASLAVGYVVPELSGQLGEALGVDEISLSPEQLRVSRRVGQDVFVSLSQQFVGWAGQTVGIEYEITRRLSVELSTSSRGSGAIDLFWRRRY